MKLLLLGASGQVGWRLRRTLAPLGELVALTSTCRGLCGDLRRPEYLAETIRATRPDVVVNAAAYTAVERAEDDARTAFTVNATACEVLARETSRLGAWLVHYSSDYVYDGSGERPWTEFDPAAPLNVYGASKLAGDQAIAAHNQRHLILRTSWVYDSRAHNFLMSILDIAASRDSLSVVSDQWGSPTPAPLIADITAQILAALSTVPAGTYHLASSGFSNWYAFARRIVEHSSDLGMNLRATPDTIQAVASSAHPARARRPTNSRLDTSRLCGTFGLALPSWQEGLREVMRDLSCPGTLNV